MLLAICGVCMIVFSWVLGFATHASSESCVLTVFVGDGSLTDVLEMPTSCMVLTLMILMDIEG